MDELEQALQIAFRREPAPVGFVQRLELRLAFEPARARQPIGRDLLSTNHVAGPIWETVLEAVKRLFAEPEHSSSAMDAAPFQGLPAPHRSPLSVAFSTAVHALAIGVIALLIWPTRSHLKSGAVPSQATAIELKPWLPAWHQDRTMGGGGGGGDHSQIEVPKGQLPRFDTQQISPPQVLRNNHPRLAVEPAIVMPKSIALPHTEMPNLGLPPSIHALVDSNGIGSGAGIGSGHNGGIGSGSGSGYGPGSGGGTGGGVYHVGGGVSAPIPIYEPEPEYSDEARRAKYNGIVIVSLIVDALGLPQHVQVIRALGMGLDEKAVEAVRQYRFKPAEYQGKPVPVEVNIEVNFQIY